MTSVGILDLCGGTWFMCGCTWFMCGCTWFLCGGTCLTSLVHLPPCMLPAMPHPPQHPHRHTHSHINLNNEPNFFHRPGAGKLDVLVNNVGTNRRREAAQATAADFDLLMGTNVRSALHLCQLCRPHLARSPCGAIVFNSSVAGGPLALWSGCVYGMTKGPRSHSCFACCACTISIEH